MTDAIWDGDVPALIKDLESGDYLYLTPAMGTELAAMLRKALLVPEGECICPKCGLRHGGSNVSADF